MAQLGYDVLQGFFAARPMPADEFVEYARNPAVSGMTRA